MAGYVPINDEKHEPDTLNYSSSEELSAINSILAKKSLVSEWISMKMKGSLISDMSSITNFDAVKSGSGNKNPFDLASSLEDYSSIKCNKISSEEIIDSNFVSGLIEISGKKKTILMQTEDKVQSCQCSVCPIS
jgi:hypothetical protein